MDTVRIALLAVSLLLLVSGCRSTPDKSSQQERPPELPFAADLQEVIEGVLRPHNGQDIGISAAVIVAGFEPWAGVSGVSYSEVAITSPMLFDAGSVAKTYVAALVLKLAEEGKLDLDGAVADWLSPLPNVPGHITVRQLLNHTSGLFNVFEHPDFPWVRPDVDYARRWSLEEVFDTFVLEPYGAPGLVQHYSSTNYLLLTVIAEKAGGASVPVLVREKFLDPLGFERTFMSEGETPADQTMAHPWADVDLDGKLEDLAGHPATWIASLSHPLVRTTAGELARWMFVLLHDRAVLSPATVDEMLALPEVIVPDPDGVRFGLGMGDFSERFGVPAFGHGGSMLGYSAAAFYLPEQEAVLVWFLNTGESPREFAAAAMSRTLERLSRVVISNVE